MLPGLPAPWAARRALPLGAQLVGEDVGDEVFLGLEVAVEGAVGQAGVGHQGCHAGAVDAVLLEASPGCFDDPLSGGLFVLGAVPRHALLRRWGGRLLSVAFQCIVL